VTGVELVAGYLVAWAVRKARQVAGRADAEVERALDAGLDRLHELVNAKLGRDAALVRLEAEAAERGEVAQLTRERVRVAVQRAAAQDAVFAEALGALVRGLHAGGGPAPASSGHQVTAGGDVEIRSSGRSVAAGLIHGTVQLGKRRPPEPPAG
jgi:hypothetical protein